MYLATLLACLATVCFASPLNDIDTPPEWRISDYLNLRNAFDGMLSLHQRLPHKPTHKSRSLPPDGAVPMWMDGHSPFIHVYVGSPPQRVAVKLDTGSGITWIHGQDPAKPLEEDALIANLSTSWNSLNVSATLTYLDSSDCTTEIVYEKLSITPDDTRLEIPMGVDQQSRCIDHFGTHGILGLDKSSLLLDAFEKVKGNLSSVFTLAFADSLAEGGGENWFSLGGYAGLDPKDIIWMPHVVDTKNTNFNHLFKVPLPYVLYRNKRFNFKKGHYIIVDTGASVGLLPTKQWEKIYNHVPNFPLKGLYNNKPADLPLFNLTDVSLCQIPTMALRLGDQEWLAQLTSPSLNMASFFGFNDSQQALSVPAFLPKEPYRENVDWNEIPSVLGAPFWMNLRGLVFDFTRGKERVGFVPRREVCNRNGVVNPLFVSAASSKRSGVGGVFAVVVGASMFLLMYYL